MAVGSFILAVSGGGLSNAGHHDWPTTKNFKTTLAKTTLSSPQKRNLYPKISDSKPHIWSLFFISDFLAENLKANKMQRERLLLILQHSFTQKASLI